MPLVKSAYQKINFLISQPKLMLWELNRTISMRQFFLAPQTYVQTDGLGNIYNFTLKNFVYLNLCPGLRCQHHINLSFLKNELVIIGLVKKNIWAKNSVFFLYYQFKHVFWMLKKPSHWTGSIEYPQHLFWLSNEKNNFQLCTHI